jgi:hypothetical protein
MTFPTQTLSFNNFPQSQVSYNRTVVSTGVTQFTVPEGVYSMSAVAIAGGGGGSGSAGSAGGTARGSAAGGGGGLTWATFSVEPDDVLEIYIGEAGAGGSINDTSGAGTAGGNSEVWLKSRGATTYGVKGAPNMVGIVLTEGGEGGQRQIGGGFAGSFGGNGNVPPEITAVPAPVVVYRYGGANGGNGGTCALARQEGAGGGGTAGYTGNGGNGGGHNGTADVNPTGAAAGSGGGGGGGNRDPIAGDALAIRGLGYGGGGVGAFGYDNNDPTTTGGAGVNNSSGGQGGSYFNDPGLSIAPDFIGSGSTDQSTFSYSNLTFAPGYSSIQPNQDFILLISGADSTSGSTLLSPPVGFNTISFSNNGVYYTNNSLSATQTIPRNVTNATRDINFSTAYQFVGVTAPTTITGLSTPAIHNIIVLRYIPNPSTFIWANDSYDPGALATPPNAAQIAAGAGFMPNPPEIGGISAGSLGIAFGFIANNVLTTGGSISGNNSLEFTKVSGGNPGILGQGVAVMGQYTVSAGGSFGSPALPVVSTNLGVGTTVDPDAFLTGTSSHARAYTIEIQRRVPANPITLVGTASTADYFDNTGTFQDVNGPLNLPSGMQNGDLILYALSWDSPGDTSNVPTISGVGFTVFTDNGANVTADENGNVTNRFNGGSDDSRAGGGMRYQVSYRIWNSATDGNVVNLNVAATGDTPSAHMLVVLRNASIPSNLNYAIWDNRTSNPLDPNGANATSYGAPDPASIVTASANSAVVSFGMLDNITISQISTVGPPTGWSPLDEKSYGQPNDGAIVMSAYKTNLGAGSTNPTPFTGKGGNIWAAQTLVIGGPGQETTGNNTSAGQWGAGGGGRSETVSGTGMNGAPGAVRLIWGGSRLYPYTDGNTGNVTVVDFVV